MDMVKYYVMISELVDSARLQKRNFTAYAV